MSSVKHKYVGFAAISLFGAVFVAAGTGCSADVGQASAENPGETLEATCSANKFYGSDTMKPLILATVAGNPVYAGSGSGNGESALRGTLTSGTNICGPAGTKELSAPMSRDLNPQVPTTNNCKSGTDDLKSKRIGLDGILALTATSNTTVNDISTMDLAKAFCLAPMPPAASPACPATLVVGGKTISKFYRRDDVSGTTDTLKSKLGCTALCNDAAHVIIPDTGTTGVRTGCLASDDATACIAKLTAANTGAVAGTFTLGYAGRSARLAGAPAPAKELTINLVAATDTNIRNSTYPLSRFLYVNYNVTMLGRAATGGAANATTAEKKFLCENIVGPTTAGCTGQGFVDRRVTFENSLPTFDFLKCATSGTPFAACTATGGPVLCP